MKCYERALALLHRTEGEEYRKISQQLEVTKDFVKLYKNVPLDESWKEMQHFLKVRELLGPRGWLDRKWVVLAVTVERVVDEVGVKSVTPDLMDQIFDVYLTILRPFSVHPFAVGDASLKAREKCSIRWGKLLDKFQSLPFERKLRIFDVAIERSKLPRDGNTASFHTQDWFLRALLPKFDLGGPLEFIISVLLSAKGDSCTKETWLAIRELIVSNLNMLKKHLSPI